MAIIEQIENTAQVAAHTATLITCLCWVLISILLITMPSVPEVAALIATSLVTSIASCMIALAAYIVEIMADSI